MGSPQAWEIAQTYVTDLNAEQCVCVSACVCRHSYVYVFNKQSSGEKLCRCRQTSQQKKQDTTSKTAAATRPWTKLKQLLGCLSWKRLGTENRATCSHYLSWNILTEICSASLTALDCVMKYLAASLNFLLLLEIPCDSFQTDELFMSKWRNNIKVEKLGSCTGTGTKI